MAPRNDRPDDDPPPPPPPALHTPLVWAGGGLLLTVTVWLSAMIALVRGVGSLFY
jgi:hypothetical protein